MALYMLCKLGYHTLSENLLVFDLLRLGADPSYAEAHDGSVLIWSILNRTHHETLAILDASADVNRMAGPWVSCSPLAAAGAKGDTYILKELIDRGADLTGYNGHCAIEGVRNAEFASTCYTTARQRQRGEKFLREHGAKIDGETEGCLVM